METGLSARNPRVQAAARLHRADERRRTGLTLLEGPHLVGEAVAAGVALAEIFALETDLGFPNRTALSQAALERLSSTRTPQSPVAVMSIPMHSLDPERDVLVAWEIADPGNLGTMIRTAAAFGLDVAVIGGADPWAPKTLRGAAGAHFHTSVVEIDNLEEIRAVRVATVLLDGDPPSALPAGRLALLIGSEAHGLSAEAIAAVEVRISIPMPGGTESLNAAAAAAILCYEVAKRA
ncbi:MAG: TrmH family RNA methyltransferase [Acidimicrobiia bacterium]